MFRIIPVRGSGPDKGSQACGQSSRHGESAKGGIAENQCPSPPAAASQPDHVLAPFLSNFELATDPEEGRQIWGYMRAFGIKTLAGTQDGDNLLHKLCQLASPPWSVRGTIPAVSHVLAKLAEMNLDINAIRILSHWPRNLLV